MEEEHQGVAEVAREGEDCSETEVVEEVAVVLQEELDGTVVEEGEAVSRDRRTDSEEGDPDSLQKKTIVAIECTKRIVPRTSLSKIYQNFWSFHYMKCSLAALHGQY